MADQTCTSCGSTMPEGAIFCTQCGSRTLVPEAPAAEADPTKVVTGGPDVAPIAPAEPDPTQVVAPPAAPPAPPAPPVTTPPAPPVTADPTQAWSSPPAAPTPPAEQGWPSAASAPPPPGAVAPGAPPTPPPSMPPSAAPPAPPVGAGWQAPTQTWDQPPAAAATPAPPTSQPYPPQPGAPVYAPAPMAAPTAAKTSSGGKFGAFVGLIGGALAIVGSFLVWVKVAPANDVSYTVTGWNLSNDAKTTLIIGAVAVVLAVVVIGGQMRGLVRLLFGLGGIALVGLASYDTYDILKKLPDRLAGSFPDGGAKITGPGIGLILVIAGGVVLILGALMMQKRKAHAQGFTPS